MANSTLPKEDQPDIDPHGGWYNPDRQDVENPDQKDNQRAGGDPDIGVDDPFVDKSGLKGKEEAADSDPNAGMAPFTGKQSFGGAGKGTAAFPDDDEGGLYTDDGKPKKKKGRFSVTQKRAAIVGTTALVSAVLGISTITSGPMQLVHLSEILQKSFHKSDEDSDSRLTRLFRYARSGAYGETRVGKLGSRSFGKSIDRLKEVGIEFQRDGFDHVRSTTVDTDKLAKKYPELKNMTDIEKKSFIAEQFSSRGFKFSADQIEGKGSNFKINSREFGVGAQRAVTKGAAGTVNGKILGAMRFRVMARFLDQPSLFHPINRAKTNLQQRISAKAEVKAETDRQQKLEEQARAKALPAEKSLKDQVKGKNLARNALLVTAGLCLIRSIADDVVKVNHDSIVVPSVLKASDKIAFGEQVKKGADFSAGQAGGVAQSLVDENGQTVWSGKALQALASMPTAGTDLPDDYQQAFTPDVTAKKIKDSLGGGPAGEIVCSPIGQAAQIVGGVLLIFSGVGELSWGARIATVGAEGASAVGTSAAITLLQGKIVDLLATKAVVPTVLAGALGGNLLAYGARESGNIAARSSGGVKLPDKESFALDRQMELDGRAEFASEGTFAKLFDTKDYRSLTGRLADSISPSMTQNFASLTTGFANLGTSLMHSFATLLPGVSAASEPYHWASPQYGIPTAVLNDESLDNPYENADKAAEIFAGPDGSKYLDKAKTCFGTDISIGVDGWDVTNTDMVNPNSDDYPDAHCDDISDTNWRRIMLFVFDTKTMKAADCYEGDSDTADQSCQDIGANTSAPADSGTPASGQVADGSLAELAQKVLDYRKSGQYKCTNPGDCIDLEKTVKGEPLAGSDGCTAKQLDPRVLKIILYAIEVGNFKIGTYALCGDHRSDGPHGHSGGLAVDFENVNDHSIGDPSSCKDALKLAQFFNGIKNELRPRQLITDGCGNQHDASFTALEIDGDRTGSDAAQDFAGDNPHHRNHIHVGY